MTGLKSGAGDDLWGEEDKEPEETTTTDTESAADSASQTETTEASESEGSETPAQTNQTTTQQPYIVRRALNDGSAQYERDHRLTSFVHDDVAAGERELVAELEHQLGRNVPKFDVREAVYRAALQNRDDVLAELVKMGYSTNQE